MNAAEKIMYDLADHLVRSAGLTLKSEREKAVITVKEKTSPMDLVTEHDLAIEKFLVAGIKEKYPDHEILAEESQTGENAKVMSGNDGIGNFSHGYRWVIDPIDGTVNYYRFGKDYAISLALYKEAEPVFGLVYDVAGDVMFRAGQAEGATMNGYTLANLPEGSRKLNKAVVAMSLRTMREFAAAGTDVLGLLSRVQAHRYLGCASLELCKVGTGDYDLFISSTVYEWDVAAARIFLEQRGGFFLFGQNENCSIGPAKLLVAAFRSPALWQETLQYLHPSMKEQFSMMDCR
jgi:myo-inositol-1(or 4)-monophosphatase